MEALPITPGLIAAQDDLDRRGLPLPISGSDWPSLPPFDPALADFESCVGACDFHSYDAAFDSMGQDVVLAEVERRLAGWASWTHPRDKPLFLSEVGSMAYGWGNDDSGPACCQSRLKNASLVVRGMNAGVDGFNRWSFVNPGDLDGQWQLLRTRDIDNNRLLKNFTPQPNAYYQDAMLSRFFPKHSGVLATSVDAPFPEKDRKLVATALRSPKSHLTILMVNENYHFADLNIAFEGLAIPVNLQRYSLSKEDEDQVDISVHPESSFEVSSVLTDTVPPMSIVVYSTYRLYPEDAGIISE